MSDLTDQARAIADEAPTAENPLQAMANAIRLLATAIDEQTESSP